MKINCYPFFICCTFVYMYNSLLKIYKDWGEGGEKDTHTGLGEETGSFTC